MHAATFRTSVELRLLASVGASPNEDEIALLSAWVGCCSEPGSDGANTGYVALEGELCAYTSSLLRDQLFEFVAYAGQVVVDLHHLRFIDSSGVEFLEQLTARQLARGGFVELYDPQPFVRRVLDLVATARAGAVPV